MKKHKLIISVIIILLVAGFVYFVSSLKLGLNSEGTEKSSFIIEFKGSKRYTDEELYNYFFESDKEKNPVYFFVNDFFNEKKQIPFVETYELEVKSPFLYEVTIYEKVVVGYLEYMGSNMYFDKDGIVVESSEVKLDDIPLVSGIKFDSIVLHEKIPASNMKVFADLLNLTQCLDKYKIEVDKIHVRDNLELIITLGNVKVELGVNDMLNEKIKDLYDIIPDMVDVKGTLYMTEYKTDGSGYTFKKD